MATKKILIQVILDDKNVASKSNKISKSVDGITRAQQKYFEALQPTNVEIEKYKILTREAEAATKAKAMAELNATEATKAGRAQSGLNNAILLETGRLASDASYGFNGMANNLGQLVTLFQSFARTNGGVVASLKELGRSLMGTGGVLIAVQLLISFLPKLEKLFKKNAEAVDEETEALKRQNDQFRDNIKLRTKNAQQARDFINLFTQDFQLILESIDYDSSKTEAKLYELSELFMGLGFERAKLLKDENIIQGDRVRIAVKLIEIYNKETKLLQIRELLNKEAAKGQEADQGFINRLKAQLVETRKDVFNLTEDIKNLSKEGIVLEPPKKDGVDDALKKRLEAEINYAKDHIKLLQEIDKATTITEEEKRQSELAEIGDYYDNLIDQAMIFDEDTLLLEEYKLKAIAEKRKEFNDEDLKNAEEARQAKAKIDKLETESKLEALDNIGKGLISASKIAGESTGVGKALAVAGTLVSTYSAGQKAYESQMILTPDAPIRAQIARAAAILQGLANVKAIMSVKSPAMKETTSVSGGTGAISVQAPDFNVVGQGGVNQLGQVIGAQFGQPIRAYVVSGDISSAQELERNITAGATID